jgi:hypothetical protein
MAKRELISLGIAAVLLLPLHAKAGEISGTLSQQGKVLAGVEVKLTCGNRNSSARTDNFGRYRLGIEGVTGRCALIVPGAQPAEVVLLASPARYDFERIGTELRRR